ncbi:subtilisin-like protein [Xylariaceae sp. FL1019]|nr:subtilisin-like protein [Xylariaceae sp. FL1019]
MVRYSFALSLLANAGSFLPTGAAKASLGSKFVPGSYVVEFEDSKDTSEFFAQIGSKAETRMNYDSPLFRGASVAFHDVASAEKEAAKLQEMASVKKVWANRLYSLPPDKVVWTAKGDSAESQNTVKRQVATEDTFSPHVMTQVDKLRANGIVGEGIKIAVIDTGVDYTHPALGGCFGPGCLVAFGTDLVGDDYTGSNTPVPDDDPYDGCAGHGSHVSGIIAAQANEYNFTGAAPGVTLGMDWQFNSGPRDTGKHLKLTCGNRFRVFGCEGSAANDVLIDAYLQAFEAGANIITASIGGSSGWSEDPWAVVVSRIVESGVPCTVSAGNDGEAGLFYASTAANGKRVTAVASVDNVITPLLLTESFYLIDEADNQTFGYSPGEPADWAGVDLPLWTPSFDTSDPAMGCEAYADDTPDLSGNIVLVRRGTCTFVLKAQNAVAKGAKYVMFYNNVPGVISPDASDVEGLEAVGMVEPAVGEAWAASLEAGSEVTLDMLDPLTAPQSLSFVDNTVTGGYASTYTSWGPTFEADVKPQVASPGGNILSTWPQTLGSYAVISGTSMACPLVAAIFALIADVRGTFDPTTLETLVASNANPTLLNDGTATYDVLASVAQIGAGLVQAYDAAYSETLISKSYLAFNDTDNLIDTLNFTVTNIGSSDVTYELSSVGAATGYTFSTSIYPDVFPGLALSDEFATITLSDSKITIPAGGEETVAVTVTPPALDGSLLPVYSGYITLNSTNGDSLSLPYQGIVGSLHDTQVLDTGYLSSSADVNLNPIAANTSFVLSKDPTADVTIPVAVALMAFGSPKLSVKLLSASGNNTLGDILDSPYDYASRDYFPFGFDGRLADGSYAPAGSYKFSIEALHIFGDASDPSEYDVAVTSPFSISYA